MRWPIWFSVCLVAIVANGQQPADTQAPLVRSRGMESSMIPIWHKGDSWDVAEYKFYGCVSLPVELSSFHSQKAGACAKISFGNGCSRSGGRLDL